MYIMYIICAIVPIVSAVRVALHTRVFIHLLLGPHCLRAFGIRFSHFIPNGRLPWWMMFGDVVEKPAALGRKMQHGKYDFGISGGCVQFFRATSGTLGTSDRLGIFIGDRERTLQTCNIDV